MKKTVILISGKKRSGKDFVASVIKEHYNSKGYNTKIMSFATPLKEIVSKTFGVSLDDLEHMKNNPDEFPIGLPTVEHTLVMSSYREVLQRLGSEGIRGVLGDDTWKNYLYDSINNTPGDIFIVPDFRFINELKESSDEMKILTVNVMRNDITYVDTHSSENGIPDEFIFDCYIDNSEHASKEKILNDSKCLKFF